MKQYMVLSFLCIFTVACQKIEQHNSCKDFVQNFYDWYVPYANNESNFLSSDVAIKEKGEFFNPLLLNLLKKESQRHSREKGVISGLDFDPFLATQDPYLKYHVSSAEIKNDICFAKIEGISSNNVPQNINLFVELKIAEGHWRFVNFHYGPTKKRKDENLIDLLNDIFKEK
jgi:hypothetical protein